MPTQCTTPFKARVLRVVRLDSCGNPVTGAGSVVVSDGFIRVQADPEYLDGEVFRQKNANGDLCINEIDDPLFVSEGISIDFCKVDPDVIVLITGQRLITGGAPVTGSGVAYAEGSAHARFSLELWQPIAGAGACTPGGLQQYMYWAFPNMGAARVGSKAFENALLTFTLSAISKAAGPQWGDGPGTGTSWLPAGFTVDTDEHFLHNVTTEPPPTATCGATALS